MTLEEMTSLANEIKSHFISDGTSVTIHSNNSYCSELNGNWNVVISLRGERKDTGQLFGPPPPKGAKKMYTYTYIICHGVDNRTYCGPLQNADYIYDINHVRFCRELYPEKFDILDKFMKTHSQTKVIKMYPILDDYVRDQTIHNYTKIQQIIKKNKLDIDQFKQNIEFYSSENKQARMKKEPEFDKFIRAKMNSISEKIIKKQEHIDSLQDVCDSYRECLEDYGYNVDKVYKWLVI